MRDIGSCLATPRWPRPVERLTTLCVVDPESDDYQAWDALAEACGLRLKFIASADEALRLARSERVDLWVVNVELPGLSRCELCSMLRSRGVQSAIYIVADEYTPKVEGQAWHAQATLFGCKGGHGGWLDDWLDHQSKGHATAAAAPHSQC